MNGDMGMPGGTGTGNIDLTGIGNMGMMGPINMPNAGFFDGAMGPSQGIDFSGIDQSIQGGTGGMDINGLISALSNLSNQGQSGQFDWDSLFGNTPGDPNASGLPGSLFGIPEMPSMWNAIGGLQPYNIPNLPQFDYEGMDPTLRASIERPYGQALDMARERLGGAGMLGTQGRENPMFSGAAGQVLGNMAQEAGPVMAQQAYNMTMPNQMQEWQAQLGQNVGGWNTGLQAIGTDYGGEMQRRNEYMQQQMLPYQTLPGMMGGTYSTPMVQQGTSAGSNLGSGLMGGMSGYAMAPLMGMNPLLGAGVMGLGSMLGGK